MAVCEKGQAFINSTKKDFHKTTDMLIDLIQTHLSPSARFVNPTKGIRTHFRGSGRSLDVDSTLRIIELEEEDLLELVDNRYAPGSLRGIYNSTYGKIILNKKLWCIETLLHELLHSLSHTAHNNRLSQQYLDYFEGLTEFYTGYLMSHLSPECYETCWRAEKRSRCYCIYQKQVKIWIGLCNFIPLKLTTPVYFFDGSSNWYEKWDSFIEDIHENGYPKFGRVIDENKKPKWLALHQECRKHFGKEYMTIYNEIANPLDLSSIKV